VHYRDESKNFTSVYQKNREKPQKSDRKTGFFYAKIVFDKTDKIDFFYIVVTKKQIPVNT